MFSKDLFYGETTPSKLMMGMKNRESVCVYMLGGTETSLWVALFERYLVVGGDEMVRLRKAGNPESYC